MTEETTTQSTSSTPSDDMVINSIPDAMRGFIKGALPPQGLDAFGKQVETTFTNIVDLYTNVFTQTFKGFEPLFQAIGELFPAAAHEACIPRKRIMINQKEKTNGETNGQEAAASSDDA